MDGETERPCPVSEYLLERMIAAGVEKVCFVISPEKSDILVYYGAAFGPAAIAYVVQPSPTGLCDAIFRALPLIPPNDSVLVGLPDTIWMPTKGFSALPDDCLSFLLFPVKNPELFDAVVCDDEGYVLKIQVKQQSAISSWIWGAFKIPGHVLHEFYALWRERDGQDEYWGTLVNAYLAAGGKARGIQAGTSYIDVGTLNGYRAALTLLSEGVPLAQCYSLLTPARPEHDR